MTTIATLGIDIGKRSFHAVGRDKNERQVKKAKFSRRKLIEFIASIPPCLIAMEGCAGAHWLGRKCKEYGHEVRLIPAQFVKPYVKTNKNDFIDADAICEAVGRPQMRFITLKTEQQQIISAWCRVRESYVVEKTAISNKIHAFFLEFGVARAKGKKSLSEIPRLLEDGEVPIPDGLREIIFRLYGEYKALLIQIKQVETRLSELLKAEPLADKLMEVHGVGLITTALLIAKVGDGKQFKSGRELAAWIGLVPRQYSTGGKSTLLGISKRGDSHLRRCLIHGARSIIQWHSDSSARWSTWLKKLQAIKPANVVCVALANKLARIVWAVMVKEPRYQA